MIKGLNLDTSVFMSKNSTIINYTDDVTGDTYWLLYSNDSSLSYETRRAIVYQKLFFSGYITSSNGITYLGTTDVNDEGLKAYNMYVYANANDRTQDVVYTNTFSGTSTKNVSIWFSGFSRYSGEIWGYMPIATQIFYEAAEQSYPSTIGTDQSSLEKLNPTGIKLRAYMNHFSDTSERGYLNAYYLTTLSSSDMSFVFSTSAVCDTYNGRCAYTNTDYSSTLNIPALSYFNPNLTTRNPWFKAGSLDGTFDWNYTGNFTGYNTTNDFNNSINSYLSTCTADSEGYCLVPLQFYSELEGALTLNNISINVTINNNPIVLNKALVESFLVNKTTSTSIPIMIHSDTQGILEVSDVRYDYRGGNKTYNVLAHTPNYTSNISYNITYYYSRWNYSLPRYIDYIEFLPKTPTSKNVSPYGQKNTTPILNITTYFYGSPGGIRLYTYLNESYSCVNLSYSIPTYHLSGPFHHDFVNGSWVSLGTFSINGNAGMWWFADYGCNSTGWSLWYPDVYFRACPTTVDVCDSELV